MPLRSLWRRCSAWWDLDLDTGCDPRRGCRDVLRDGAVSVPGLGHIPAHLLPERPCDRHRRGASPATGLGSRCACRCLGRRGCGSVTSAGEEWMPPLGLACRPRRAAVEAGYIVLGMAPAHHGLCRQLGMRQQPAGGGTRSSPPAGRRQVRPDSSPDGECNTLV